MIIRPIQDADHGSWDALHKAYAAFYGVEQTADMRAKVWGWLTDPSHDVDGLVAVEGDTLIGFAHIRPFARPLAAATGLFLDDLFVSPDARGSGAAPALINAIKAHAETDGHSIVRWITAPDNARARGLYDKHATATPWVTYDLTV